MPKYVLFLLLATTIIFSIVAVMNGSRSTVKPDAGSAMQSRSSSELKINDRQARVEGLVDSNDKELLTVQYRVPFQDGSSLPVRMRILQAEEWFEVDSLALQFDELEARAENGDAAAAVALAQALSSCREFGYQSEEEVRETLASIESEHRIPIAYSEGGPAFGTISGDAVGDVDVEYWKQSILDTYELCKGVTADQISQRDGFMNMAAESGSILALNTRANTLPPGKHKLLAFEELWARGDGDALGWIGKGYGDGWSGENPDPVKEYAYTYLFLELVKISLSDQNGNVSPFYDKIREGQHLEEKEIALSHEEHGRAIELAKSTLLQNVNCCTGLWSGQN